MYVCMYMFLLLWFLIGDHCSCFSDGRIELKPVIFKSDGSDLQYEKKKLLTVYLIINHYENAMTNIYLILMNLTN